MEKLKSLAQYSALLINMHDCSVPISKKDREVFFRRLETQGLPFLTKLMPSLGKALDASFNTGVLDIPFGFQTSKKNGLPLLFNSTWAVLYNKDLTLRYDTDELSRVAAVKFIRQISFLSYKLCTTMTSEQIDDASASFVQTEVDMHKLHIKEDDTLKRARKLVCWLLAKADPREISPRHGTGASACRTEPSKRYMHMRDFPRLTNQFSFTDYFVSGKNHMSEGSLYNEPEEADEIDYLTDLKDDIMSPFGPESARVLFVPKDSRGPRLISCEPREYMYIQQGLMTLLMDTVTSGKARLMLPFKDQTVNQKLARSGSKDGSYATIDLKEASDRVHSDLVRLLFPPNWWEALNSARTQYTTLPCGTTVPLKKFAPMGSATCFPVESIVFWAITLAASPDSYHIEGRKTKFPTMSVFGDDIIVPSALADNTINALESYGLLVNREKSFTNGPFRESCGGDFYLGHDVAPVRIKTLPDLSLDKVKFVSINKLNARDSKEMFIHIDILNRIFMKHTQLTSRAEHLLFCQEYFPSVPIREEVKYWRTTYEGTTTKVVNFEGHGKFFPSEAVLLGIVQYTPRWMRRAYISKFGNFCYRIPSSSPEMTEVSLTCWGQVLHWLLTQPMATLSRRPRKGRFIIKWSYATL